MNLDRRTKIVCTIGPSSRSASVVEGLIRAGMNVARLNFSHGTHQDHAAYIHTIRETASALKVPIAVLQDLPGPKIRTGKLSQSEVLLKEGDEFTITTDVIVGDEHRVSTNLPGLPQSVEPGDAVYLNDGAIRLKVLAKTSADVQCLVITGGVLEPGKGINVPGVTLRTPSFLDVNLHHLAFSLEQSVDLVALSFVREAEDVRQVRRFLRENGADTPLIAKIEKWEACQNLDAILAEADGLMVARGDLGVEIPLEKVPLVQKEIIRKCNLAGKPVITATQMLESMVKLPFPTRAEVTDIANSIFDGTDAIMLSGETAIGRYPLEAVGVMARTALETEAALPYSRMLTEKGAALEPQTDDAIAFSACHTAHQLGAAAIVAFTSSGSTARRVSKYRPRMPILAATPSSSQKRRLLISWGVYPYEVAEPASVHEVFSQGASLSLATGIARKGDLIVITAGLPLAVPGTTNLLKVERVE